MRLLAAVLLFSLRLVAQTQPVNLDFESGNVGQVPTGWSAWAAQGLRYGAAISVGNCVQGNKCAVLTGPGVTGSYSGFSQSFKASSYAGKTIRFRAAVRTEGNSYGQLWVRVDSASTYLVNILSSSLTSNQWTYASVDVPVGASATVINLGFLTFGAGFIVVDDASLTVLQPGPVDAARPLSETGLANVTAFARLLGYVRHFHPSSQVAAADWDALAIQGVRGIESAATPQDLATQLQAWCADVAPTVRVFVAPNRPELPAELRPASIDALRLVRWNHYGVGLGTGSTLYHSELQFEPAAAGALPEEFEDPQKPWEAELGRGVSALVPLTVYADAQGTLPRRAIPGQSSFAWSVEDRATRMAALMLAWNVIQHFYPYHDAVEMDWPAELSKALRSAATDNGAADFTRTLKRLVAAMKDGHGSVVGPVQPDRMVPLIWDWVEGQLIVTRVKADQGQGVAPGDRVLKISDRPVDEVIAEAKELISGATPQWIMWRTLNQIAYCELGRNASLDIEPFGQPGTSTHVQYNCGTDLSWSEPHPPVVTEVEPGIWYVDINALTYDIWQQWVTRLASAKGIVFDLRGYPQTIVYLQGLSSASLSSSQWHIPIPAKPDRTDLRFSQSGWDLPPAAPLLTARRVLLTDGRAISYAETEMAIVENYKLAEIVGSTTAGTNGNINRINLPGGFYAIFTGMKVLKHDGSQYHGVGVRATIPAARTRRGIAEGLDEVLLRGIEVVKGPQAGSAPAIAEGGIVNAASGKAGPVAPGEMVTIYGTGLGPDSLVQTAIDDGGFLANYAGGTRVFFDGIQAPVVHASATQVTAVVPYSVPSTTKVRVEYELRTSNEVSLPVAAAAPGVFGHAGKPQAVVVNQAGSFNSDATPAARGEIVTLFATGEGKTTPASIDGRQPANGKWPAPVGSLSVTFGGAGGEVVFQGVISPGVLQVNVKVPQAAPAGSAVPLVLKVAGAASQQAAIALK